MKTDFHPFWTLNKAIPLQPLSLLSPRLSANRIVRLSSIDQSGSLKFSFPSPYGLVNLILAVLIKLYGLCFFFYLFYYHYYYFQHRVALYWKRVHKHKFYFSFIIMGAPERFSPVLHGWMCHFRSFCPTPQKFSWFWMKLCKNSWEAFWRSICIKTFSSCFYKIYYIRCM